MTRPAAVRLGELLGRAPSSAPVTLRLVTIVAREPASLSCSVNLSGDTTVTLAGVPTDPRYVPRVGDIAWAVQHGPGLLVLGSPSYRPPSARLIRNAAQSIPTGANTVVTLNTTMWDNDGMADLASNRITVAWPGRYLINSGVEWAPLSSASVTRRRLRVVQNSTDVIDHHGDSPGANNGQEHMQRTSRTRTLAAGDNVRVEAFQDTGGGLNINALNEYSPFLELTWLGPT